VIARAFAEFAGTLVLVLFGCGAAVLGGDHVGQVGIAMAFGLAIVAAAYAFGPISGAHVNPAVSLGVFLAGRMSARDLAVYWVAQCVGAIVGAGLLCLIAGQNTSLGQNGWGPGYNGEFTLVQAAVFEVAMTAVFVLVILGSTAPSAPQGFAGLCIGATLTAIHLVGIQVTGVSVNPARSLGPALLVGGHALGQLWLFFVAPLAGGAIAAAAYRYGLPSAPAASAS
jgi:aquaporin Z